MSKNIREAAFVSLMRIDSGNKYSNIELDSAIKRWNIDGPDKALFTTIVYGVIERKITLDYIIGQFANVSEGDIDEDVRCVLRIAFYQILFLDRIPDHAATNEAVEMCRKRCRRGNSAAGFVNAVIRSLLRGQSNIKYPDRKSNELLYLSVKYSFPIWLVKMWTDAYGERAEQIMASSDKHPMLTVCANTLRCDRLALASMMTDSGYHSVISDKAPRAVKLSQSAAITDLQRDFDGIFYVQDEASQLAARALGAKKGEKILDACAAPGGKSFYIALDMENCGSITSCDIHSNKLSLISSTAKSLGIDIISVCEQNAALPREDFIGAFDRIICDVPCSGLGVIAKKPDLRYKNPDDIERLPQIQYSILDNCAQYVKKGGVILYSTCTINRAENDDIAEKFTSEHLEYTLIEKHTFFPDSDGCDGFFYALFTR